MAMVVAAITKDVGGAIRKDRTRDYVIEALGDLRLAKHIV